LNESDIKNINIIIKKYKLLSNLFFANPDKNFVNEMIFSFANRLFEYCFKSDTFQDFHNYVNSVEKRQIARMIYAIIWFNLIGRGWKDWSNQSLANIFQRAKSGDRVVYIAGGSDIYRLLKYGIYNIDVIDPFLPTQRRYYSLNDWEWLVKSNSKNYGLGDKIQINFEDKKIDLIRKRHKKNGYASLLLSNNKRYRFEKTVTDWEVYNHNDNSYLGVVTIYRRPCEQSDFFTNDKRVILMAINELRYAFLSKELNGWGIRTDYLRNDFKVYVKQLHNPVDIDMLNNIKNFDESNLDFIYMRSQIN